MASCDTCSKEEVHYHIVVEKGKVTEVWYMSADGYWDRDLEKDEYFVEYREDPQKSGSVKKFKAVKKPKPGRPAAADWLQPKVYKGKSMHQEELERLGKK
jgi:hypothetical protein